MGEKRVNQENGGEMGGQRVLRCYFDLRKLMYKEVLAASWVTEYREKEVMAEKRTANGRHVRETWQTLWSDQGQRNSFSCIT